MRDRLPTELVWPNLLSPLLNKICAHSGIQPARSGERDEFPLLCHVRLRARDPNNNNNNIRIQLKLCGTGTAPTARAQKKFAKRSIVEATVERCGSHAVPGGVGGLGTIA